MTRSKLSAIALGLLCASALLPASAANAPSTGAPPGLNLSGPGVAWMGFIAPKESDYEIARTFNDYSNPPTGIPPVSDDPAHPFANNEVAREMRIPPTYRVADVNNAAGKNLMPWVVDALKAQNALALQGKNGESREARCWETGVPAFHLNPGAMHIVQTPKEVVLFLAGRTRHIWLNLPHSANPKPSWYGESVGHYEGDTLVVDTIGQNEKTYVDNYRTPHTAQLHVIERFRLINDGKTIEVNVHVEDPGAFTAPWDAIQRYRRTDNPWEEMVCPENNAEYFGYELVPLPHADKLDF
jgi:hypothetical protein